MLFSIIIPCYNVEKYISRTLDSVLSQTYNKFEVIIVNDGSTDKTLDKIEVYRHRDSRISIHNKTNGGVSSARNYGLKYATGDYILFLDGDDFIDSTLLESASIVFKRNRVVMYSYGYRKIRDLDASLIKRYSFSKYNNKIFTGNEFMRLFFAKSISQHLCSFIVKRDIVNKNQIRFNENTKYAEDQEFQLKCMSVSNFIYYSSKELFLYVDRAGSAMNQSYHRENFDVYKRMKEYVDIDNIDAYYNYLCYVFIINVRMALNNNASELSFIKLLEMESVLERFTLQPSKYSIIALIFKVCYNIYYRKKILKSIVTQNQQKSDELV